MASKYVDIPATMQVIAHTFLHPEVIDMEDKYHFLEDDFATDFHKIIFGSIYNLYKGGANAISIANIEDYLATRPKKLAVYQKNKGTEYLQKLISDAQSPAFDFYYQRMKKMALLRAYDTLGVDVTFIYDIDNVLDLKKKQTQEDWLDKHSLAEIATEIDHRIEEVKLRFINNADEAQAEHAGKGMRELLESLKANPDFGIPLYDSYLNTIFRGARKKKVYMRSAATGLGKTRTMIADACTFACSEIYDTIKHEWKKLPSNKPTLFISTEQENDELRTMIIAFVAGVNEEHILSNFYINDEASRVMKAIEIIESAPLFIEEFPDFSMQDIENTIKYNIREHGIEYICFDYIHTSMKILSEISGRAKVSGLREDNVLFLIGVRLKDLANEYNVFILTATQLNGGYTDAKEYDQNLLRGAKSLGDKIDGGMILLSATDEDRDALQDICATGGYVMPDAKISIYKNRRGQINHCLLWCSTDRGTCRINGLFCTTYNYEFIEMTGTDIRIKKKGEVSFK